MSIRCQDFCKTNGDPARYMYIICHGMFVKSKMTSLTSCLLIYGIRFAGFN